MPKAFVRYLACLVLIAAAAWAPLDPRAARAQAEAEPERIALVIGNGAYRGLGALANPVADARLISATLASLGFDVVLLLDSDLDAMKGQVAAFGRRLRASGPDAVGLFYYAGHGVQSEGRNYLLPVDAEPTDPADLDLMGVEANWVLRQMESAGNATNIVILDACRNNPFVARTRSISQGLARLDAPTGSFIAYATAPGDVAYDGSAGNSPFTAALARALPEPGVPIEQMFKQVRLDVLRETEGRQTPWDSSSLVTDFAFNGAAAVALATPPATPLEQSMWEAAQESRDPGKLALFLQMYPGSSHAEAARALLSEVMLQSGGLSGTVGTPVAAPEPTAAPEAVPEPPEAPVASEQEMIAAAQASGAIDDYRAYLAAYPDGIFAALAEAEIAHIEQSREIVWVGEPPDGAGDGTGDGGAEVAALPPPPPPGGPVMFAAPIPTGPEGLAGLTIEQVLAGASPQFPPIEGLDAAIWQNQNCATCHAWTRDDLCTQGKGYHEGGAARIGRHQHPFGGAFKSHLALWAADGCQ